MLPIANNILLPTAQTLPVYTGLPDNSVTPTVSSAQPAANASGKNGVYLSSDNGSGGNSAQTEFLTQLLGQDDASQTQGVLAEYNKLVALSDVKYKPSNAAKPLDEPAGVFSKILQKTHDTAPAPAIILPTSQTEGDNTTPQTTTSTAQSEDNAPQEPTQATGTEPPALSLSTRALSAYATRANSFTITYVVNSA